MSDGLERDITLHIRVCDSGARISLVGMDERETVLSELISEDVVARVRARLGEPLPSGCSAGMGLFGDLFSASLRAPVEAALAWASAGSSLDDARRRLSIIIASDAREVLAWPLELFTHPKLGVLGARPWCRVLRSPEGGWPAPGSRRRLKPWREEAIARVEGWADEALAARRWEEAAALLRSLLVLERHAPGRRGEARALASLARVLSWTEGERPALEAAREAASLARRARDPLAQRQALRFQADLIALRGEAGFDEADALLGRAIAIDETARDLSSEADDRVARVRLRFAHARDREAVAVAPAARRACRHAGRRDLEGRLDAALGIGALRHDHPRAGRLLLEQGLGRLRGTGLTHEAAEAGTQLGFLLLRSQEDELAAAVFVSTLAAVLSTDDPAEGLVVEGVIGPLFSDLAPHMLRRRRPDVLSSLGFTLLCLVGAGSGDLAFARVPSPLALVVAWAGRLLMLDGWVAEEGAVVEAGVSTIVAQRVAQRARRLSVHFETLSAGAIPAVYLQRQAIEAAHRTVRHPVGRSPQNRSPQNRSPENRSPENRPH